MIRGLVLTTVVTLALPAWIAAPAAAAAPPSGHVLGEVDRSVREGMDRSGVPGLALAVVSGGRTVHARGFGETGRGRPVTPRTPFVLGSTSKSFTALAVMQLVDEGRVKLDAPVRRYLPEFKPAGGQDGPPITVRQVLRQTSGLPPDAGGPIMASVVEGTAAEAVRELDGVETTGDPGEAFAYSNANYVLAGLLIQRVSGERYGDYIERHIFGPLGMRDSFARVAPARDAGLATGHRFRFGLITDHGPTFRLGIQPAGYLISSADDMARYLAMYLDGGVGPDGNRVVSRRGLQTMLSPGLKGTLGPWADGAAARYAMGWYFGGPWEEPALVHFGRTPDSGSMIAMLPGRRLGVVTLVNAANQISVPGYPAPIERIQRNTVDTLTGETAEPGTSLPGFYLRFNIVVLALLLGSTLLVVRSGLSLRRGRRPKRPVLAAIGAVAAAVGGLLFAAVPILTFGWRGWFLWQPDLALTLALLAALLVSTAILQATTLLVFRNAGDAPG
ncbi:MAG: beta-lactamase family protein [Solirubrobacterales bacterium]|nr:beta-lactamase family protein [Solirubrobacterales bacterium]